MGYLTNLTNAMENYSCNSQRRVKFVFKKITLYRPHAPKKKHLLKVNPLWNRNNYFRI